MAISPEEYDKALEVLSQVREFDWLTKSGQQWYSIAEVADVSGVGRESIRKWCETGDVFPDAINYQPAQIGWRIPKSNLIMFYYRKQRTSYQQKDKAG